MCCLKKILKKEPIKTLVKLIIAWAGAAAFLIVLLIGLGAGIWLVEELISLIDIGFNVSINDYMEPLQKPFVIVLGIAFIMFFISSLLPVVFTSSRKFGWFVFDIWWNGIKLISWFALLLFTGVGVYLFFQIQKHGGGIDPAKSDVILSTVQTFLAIIGVVVAAVAIYVGQKLKRLEEIEKKIEASFQNLIISVEMSTLSLPDVSFITHIPYRFVDIMEGVEDVQFRHPFIFDELEKSGNGSRVFYALALYHYALGNWETAQKYLSDKVLKRKNLTRTDQRLRWGAWFRQGMIYRQRENYQDSIDAFSKLERDAKNTGNEEIITAARMGQGLTKLKQILKKIDYDWVNNDVTIADGKEKDWLDELKEKDKSPFSKAVEKQNQVSRLYYWLRLYYMTNQLNTDQNRELLENLCKNGEILALAQEDKAIRANLYETLALLSFYAYKVFGNNEYKESGKKYCELSLSLAESVLPESFIYSEKYLSEVKKDDFKKEVEKDLKQKL